MSIKILRARHYWLTIREDCNEYVKSCKNCQEFGNLNHIPFQDLQGIVLPWSFVKWGMDILGSFPLGRG